MVKTKIIATLGPTSSQASMLRKMVEYGLDVVRLNFSHGTHAGHIANIRTIRAINKRMRRSIKVMQDLEGYRVRIGRLKESLMLRKNASVYLTGEDTVGEGHLVPFDYHRGCKDIKPGNTIYIDDGKIILLVKGCENNTLKTKVVRGGVLKEKKGMNILGAPLKFDAITEKDKKDIKVGIAHDVEYVAQSFVRNAADLKGLKSLFPKRFEPKVFAKIENRMALENIDEIIDEADGIIIARGDLGITMPIYKVPVIQKEIIKKCLLAHKPAVVATQMLDSMTTEITPTRAEVSDVANAILDGAQYLLVSQETAVGVHPHRVIKMMNQIIKHTEQYQGRMSSLLM
ncbi:MAG: pyruvate kinase [Candidatus Omnitrophica bacterium]|nr:pyruvate kinase [Candidatus Omnitrophota bacterium]